MKKNKKQLARLLFNVFRVILALSLIYILFYYEVIEWKKLIVLATSPYMALLTIVMLILTLPIVELRWWILLKLWFGKNIKKISPNEVFEKCPINCAREFKIAYIGKKRINDSDNKNDK